MSTQAVTATLPELRAVSIDQLHEHPLNARRTFHPETMKELAASIGEIGIQTPLLVRPNGKGYQIIGGHRRYRCAKDLGLPAVPVLVRQLEDEAALELMLIDNLQREGLHALEEAEGYQQLMARKYDVARIAEKVGRSVKYVYDRVKLLQLTKEAQEIFRENRMSPGHAILLARLKPADQKRAIDPDAGVLFEGQDLLFKPHERGYDRKNPLDTMKPISVRELQAWIDQHVKFDRDNADPMLFPDTVATVQAAQEVAEKVVQVTYSHFVHPDAKAGTERVFGPMSWKRADGKEKGSKACDRSVTGVIVAGAGRGEAFKVCVDKKGCKVHWSREQAESKRRAQGIAKSSKSGESYYERQQRQFEAEERRREARQRRWRAALPAILEAVAAAVKKASIPKLADALVDARSSDVVAQFVARGKTADDLVRHAVFVGLYGEATDMWRAPSEFPKAARPFGIDVKKIVSAVPDAKCVECGCTDEKACKGGCSWIKEPDANGLGLCSECADKGKK